jgi:hypothetical protein
LEKELSLSCLTPPGVRYHSRGAGKMQLGSQTMYLQPEVSQGG